VVLGFVVEDLVVDLIGENNQVMLAGDLDDLHQQLFEYTAPVGLFGLIITMPRVRGVIFARISSRSGNQSEDSSHR
jgi:hypothetical protein